jgi:DNA-binding transcriptional LysR family regulator
MTLRQLAYFVTVVEEGSFTRAAARLFVSQPALSHQIAALERSLGGPLLDRLPGTVRPTPMGVRLLPHARATVTAAEEATAAAQAVGRLEAGELRVAALLSVALGIVPATIHAWRGAYPGVRVELLEFERVDALAEAMTQGLADVAVGPAPPEWRGTIRPIGAERLAIVLAADDPLLLNLRVPLSLSALAERPWVLYAPDTGLGRVVADACAAAGFVPRASARVHHTATALELAAAGVGAALVPSNVIGPQFAGCTAWPDPPIERALVAFTRGEPLAPAAAFIALLLDHATL